MTPDLSPCRKNPSFPREHSGRPASSAHSWGRPWLAGHLAVRMQRPRGLEQAQAWREKLPWLQCLAGKRSRPAPGLFSVKLPDKTSIALLLSEEYMWRKKAFSRKMYFKMIKENSHGKGRTIQTVCVYIHTFIHVYTKTITKPQTCSLSWPYGKTTAD